MIKRLRKLRVILVLLPILILGCDDDPVTIEVDEKVTIRIHDYEYVKRQFFYLETPGDDFQSPEYGFGMFYPVIGGANGDSLEVFISLRPDIEWDSYAPKYYVEAWNDPNNDGDLNDGYMFAQWFYLLTEGRDYDLIQDNSAEAYEPKFIGIRLRQPLGDDKALAVRYKMDQGGGTIVTVGDYHNFPFIPIETPPVPDPSLRITAELICPVEYYFLPENNPYALYGSTWNMMFRNVYAFDFNTLDPNIIGKWEIHSTWDGSANPATHEYSGEKYLRIFGLDRYRRTGNWGSDGYIDIIKGIVSFQHGHVMFPSLAPFNVSKEELYAWFSESEPPDYWLSDSMLTMVDSLSSNLERNSSIYNEPFGCVPAHYYDIVIEIPIEE